VVGGAAGVQVSVESEATVPALTSERSGVGVVDTGRTHDLGDEKRGEVGDVAFCAAEDEAAGDDLGLGLEVAPRSVDGLWPSRFVASAVSAETKISLRRSMETLTDEPLKNICTKLV